jgi:hypothetical protein
MTEHAWMIKARQLEAAGKLKEMEETLKNAIPHLSFAYAIASLYSERMVRLQQQRDTEGAAAAYQEAKDWIYFYNAQATSGGEGMALAVEKEAFLKELNALYKGPR